MKFEEIKELIELLSQKDISRLKIKDKNFEIVLEKGLFSERRPKEKATPSVPTPTSTPLSEPPKEQKKVAELEGTVITSPMVGTFYIAPSPDSPPFIKVGDSVRQGTTLCILEAMKIMNELEAEFDCKILEVLVQDGEPVEYDKPLFRVEKL
jgi:acetyl-CoA carboxylase biotin carboxyl carrier protein